MSIGFRPQQLQSWEQVDQTKECSVAQFLRRGIFAHHMTYRDSKSHVGPNWTSAVYLLAQQIAN